MENEPTPSDAEHRLRRKLTELGDRLTFANRAEREKALRAFRDYAYQWY